LFGHLDLRRAGDQDEKRDSAARGANVNLADRDGVTPLAHARKHNYRAITAILEKAGAR
jgi:hypothetical protein